MLALRSLNIQRSFLCSCCKSTEFIRSNEWNGMSSGRLINTFVKLHPFYLTAIETKLKRRDSSHLASSSLVIRLTMKRFRQIFQFICASNYSVSLNWTRSGVVHLTSLKATLSLNFEKSSRSPDRNLLLVSYVADSSFSNFRLHRFHHQFRALAARFAVLTALQLSKLSKN